jgi:hypothetical protein
MPNITGSFDTIKGHNGDNLRKMLELAIFLAPYESAGSAITTITDTAGVQLVIPDVYKSVGMTSKDEGVTWTPNVEMSSTGAYGYGAAVRHDQMNREQTLGFTMLEAKRTVFEVYYGIDLSAVSAPATKNEIGWATPSRPATKRYRAIAIGKDGFGTDAIFHAEFLPKVIVSDVGELTWSESDPESYAVTLTPEVDSTLGYSQYTFWGGPGLTTPRLTAMGFTRAA